MTLTALYRLATYGTLVPGGINHHQMSGMSGTWSKGYVRGKAIQSFCGADLGYPGLLLDASAPLFSVQVFTSTDLPNHWSRLDAFEGAGYVRRAIGVELEAGVVPTSIYVLRHRNMYDTL